MTEQIDQAGIHDNAEMVESDVVLSSGAMANTKNSE